MDKFKSIFEILKFSKKTNLLKDLKYNNDWVSWDAEPWKNPWLDTENLTKIRDFSREFIASDVDDMKNFDINKLSISWTGNLANSAYMKCRALRRAGHKCPIYLHPHDAPVIGHPVWEESSFVPANDELIINDAGHLIFNKKMKEAEGFSNVTNVFSFPVINDWRKLIAEKKYKWVDPEKLKLFDPYFAYFATLNEIQKSDVVWGASNGVYFPYLAKRPYVASQTGGDLWYEASRGDMIGALMRLSYANSRVILASNPWTFSHARRFGFKNAIYLPVVIDETHYTPGNSDQRALWESSGGSFFVFSSGRLDNQVKGSSIGINAFANFSKTCSEARLVLTTWGRDNNKLKNHIKKLGILNKTILLPFSSKGMIREYLRSADVFLDQFVLGYYGSSGLEALASGLPVIGRIEKNQYDCLCETGAPPILNACCVEDVEKHLLKLYAEKNYLREVGLKSRDWFLQNHSYQIWEKRMLSVLAATAEGKKTTFNRSVLSKRLTSIEKNYYKEELRRAPTFPNYE